MQKESIILLRHKFESSGIKIFANNDLLFNSQSEFTTLVWDDANSLLYAFRPNNSHYTQDKKRISVDVNEYADLQCLSTGVTREQLVVLLNDMKAEGTVTDEVIAEILKDHDNLNNKLL